MARRTSKQLQRSAETTNEKRNDRGRRRRTMTDWGRDDARSTIHNALPRCSYPIGRNKMPNVKQRQQAVWNARRVCAAMWRGSSEPVLLLNYPFHRNRKRPGTEKVIPLSSVQYNIFLMS